MNNQLTESELETIIDLASARERYTPDQYAAIRSAERVLSQMRSDRDKYTCPHCASNELKVLPLVERGYTYAAQIVCARCRSVLTDAISVEAAERRLAQIVSERQHAKQAGEG